MPVRVTVSRGTPLPWPIAVVFTLVGAGLIVAGFTVIGKVEVPGQDGGVGWDASPILTVVAIVLVVPAWLIYAKLVVRRARERRAATEGVPRELPEPPGRDDPALVATVVEAGHPTRRAVAATVLGLADRGALTIGEHGDKVVIDVATDASSPVVTDQLVLASLRQRANADGHVVGPPVWPDEVDWWRDYTRDARARATSAGLLETRIPFVGLMMVTILTSTAFALIFFWYIASFIGFVLLANGLPHLIARASGYRLSAAGLTARAQWIAFGRWIRAHQSLREVGPAGVAVWGPNLVYGVLVGEGDKAARLLSPQVGPDEPDPARFMTEYTTEL